MENMLKYDPDKRISVEGALLHPFLWEVRDQFNWSFIIWN